MWRNGCRAEPIRASRVDPTEQRLDKPLDNFAPKAGSDDLRDGRIGR